MDVIGIVAAAVALGAAAGCVVVMAVTVVAAAVAVAEAEAVDFVEVTVVVVVVDVVDVVVLHGAFFLVSVNVIGSRLFLHGHVGSRLGHDSISLRTSSPSPHCDPSLLLQSLQVYAWSGYGCEHPCSPPSEIAILHVPPPFVIMRYRNCARQQKSHSRARPR